MTPNKRFVPGINRVIVKPLRAEQGKGVLHDERFIDEHFSNAVWGIVRTVPEKLFFWETPKELSIGQEVFVNVSMPWQTEIEVEAGDYVLFDYLAAMDGDYKFKSSSGVEHYAIPYELLIARRRESEGERLYPLNGYMFLEVGDSRHVVGGIEKEVDYAPDMTRGRVVMQGKPKFRYLMSKDADYHGINFVGKTVGYKKHKAFRIEIEEYAKEEVEGSKWALYAMHQKDAVLTIQT